MMSQHIDLPPKDRDIVEAILKMHLPPDVKVGVFGSRAKGTARRGSDLDLMIDAGRQLTREEELALTFAFEDSDLPIRVDVVDRHSISDSFWAVVKDGVVGW